MNKKKKLLTVAAFVILLLTAAVFTASAANHYSVDENTTYVTNFGELERALEVTSNETNPPDKLVVLKNNIDYEESVPDDWSYQDEQEWYSEITIRYPGKITLDLNGKTLKVTTDSSSDEETRDLFGVFYRANTDFTITTTQSGGQIIFNSTASDTSMIIVNNPNANVNILGKAGNFINYNLTLIAQTGSNTYLNDTNIHHIISFNNINNLYITGTLIQNLARVPSCIYSYGPGPQGNVTITGNSEIEVISNKLLSNQPFSTIYFKNAPSSRKIRLGGCYIGKKGNVNSIYYGGKYTHFYDIVLSQTLDKPSYVIIHNGTKYYIDWADFVMMDADIKIASSCHESNADLEERTSLLGHYKYCKKCNALESFQEHQFGRTLAAKEATCTQKGKTVGYECFGCEYYEGYTELPALGHYLNSVYTVDWPATCDRDGRESRRCKRTGCDYAIQRVIPKRHQGIICNGTYCQACNQYINPTKIGYGDNSCKNQTAYFFTPTETNVYLITIILSNSGSENIQGTEVNLVENNRLSASISRNDKGKVTEVRLEKGKTYDITPYIRSGSGGNSDCVVNISCKEHNEVIDPGIKATCTKAGLTDGKHCSTCGKVLVPQTEAPALGHNVKTVVQKATLSADGKTEEKCSLCNTVFSSKKIAKIASVKLSKTALTYNGKAQKPSVTVKDANKKALKNGTDYTVSYSSNKKVGKATVVITFKGDYSGSKKLSFNILPAATSKIAVKQTTSSITASWKKVAGANGYRVYLYKGKKLVKKVDTTKLTLTFKKLSKGTEYRIVVKAYKTIDGKKVLSLVSKELLTATKLSAPTSVKVKAGKKNATVSWKKDKSADSYTVYYSTKKNSGFKKLTVTKNSANVKKLSSGKTYYFKVVANKKAGKAVVASDYSKLVSAKIK